MASEKSVYLVAVVVLTFGLGNSLIEKHMDWVACLSDQVDGWVDRVSDHVSSGEARVESLTDPVFIRSESRIERGKNAVVKTQMKLACAQIEMARRRAEMARTQAERTRGIDLDQMQRDLILERQNIQTKILKRQLTIPSNDTI
jgi:hypothetical protein